MNLSDIANKVKTAPSYVKAHWNKPNEGEYLPLKEVVAYTVAQAGTYIFATASGIMPFAATHFCGYVSGIAVMDFYIINLITTIVGYVLMFLNPIGILIYENHGYLTRKMKIFAHLSYSGQILLGIACYFIPINSFEFIIGGLPQIVGNILLVGGITNYFNWFMRRKFSSKHGRLKPFLFFCGIPAGIIISVIPYLPVQNLEYAKKLIILHLAFTLMTYFLNMFIGTNAIVTFLSPNSQERQRLHSIIPIITGMFPSIISMFFPILISKTGGYLDIRTYRVFVPIFAFVGVLASLAIIHCKERVIEAPIEQRHKVTFFAGAKKAFKNKYLWIINIANTLGQWQWLIGSLLEWWFIYSLRKQIYLGFAMNFVVIGMTAGNILCTILTKRFEKRTIMITARAVTLVAAFGILLAVKTESIALFLGMVFMRNTIQPIVDGVNAGLGADIQDYHQWRFGERSDSMSGVFSWFLNPITMAIGYIMPWLLGIAGLTSDYDVLFDSAILNNVFSIYTWGTIAGIIMITIPYFFYDLTREKHDMCVNELKLRFEAEQNTAGTN